MLLIIACLFIPALSGCEKTKSTPHVIPRQQTSSATRPATVPTLGPVDYHSRVYLARYDKHITISRDGRIRREGGMATGQKGIAEGNLSRNEIANLAELFVVWEKLNSNYAGVPDGPEYEITYNGKTVSFGGDQPPELMAVRNELERLGAALGLGR